MDHINIFFFHLKFEIYLQCQFCMEKNYINLYASVLILYFIVYYIVV